MSLLRSLWRRFTCRHHFRRYWKTADGAVVLGCEACGKVSWGNLLTK